MYAIGVWTYDRFIRVLLTTGWHRIGGRQRPVTLSAEVEREPSELQTTKTMRAIVQRVTQASVTVGGEQVSSIGRGLLRKILNLRLFEDENGRAWTKSVMDRDFEVLCVSQFTLQCILKGNKPDFHAAMPAELAQPFYDSIMENMRSTYKPELIKDGKFGAYMQVHIQNDGPVTVELTSPTGPTDPKQLSKQEKQQQRKEKTRSKGPSESSREKGPQRHRQDHNASSGAEGDVSSEREP
ncbi:D-aminoacyl-tRNA deacylase 1 [Nibea albiflora]|uniref:D-aminoacyl-tRNA deacylase 1 n=1 Tax=Nibea albiflora TaxID=240163 RepID=A0ACB7FKN6_NIBAL|nr:D-aminoacyl-tRNA deacylase 1 [Nibea albiflora]